MIDLPLFVYQVSSQWGEANVVTGSLGGVDVVLLARYLFILDPFKKLSLQCSVQWTLCLWALSFDWVAHLPFFVVRLSVAQRWHFNLSQLYDVLSTNPTFWVLHSCMMSSFHCHQAWGFSLCAPGGGQLQSQHLGTQVKTPLWLFSMSAIRELGVTHVLATTACGSLRESITPGLFLLPSSFIGIDSDICSSSQTKQNQTGRLGGNSPSIPMMD